MNNIQLIALTAAALNSHQAIPTFTDTTKHASIGAGRIVGWDNGKAGKQQGRNESCSCRSGRKFKHCCLRKQT